MWSILLNLCSVFAKGALVECILLNTCLISERGAPVGSILLIACLVHLCEGYGTLLGGAGVCTQLPLRYINASNYRSHRHPSAKIESLTGALNTIFIKRLPETAEKRKPHSEPPRTAPSLQKRVATQQPPPAMRSNFPGQQNHQMPS